MQLVGPFQDFSNALQEWYCANGSKDTFLYTRNTVVAHFRKGIEGAALVHSVGAVNEFPEARDYSSIYQSY